MNGLDAFIVGVTKSVMNSSWKVIGSCQDVVTFSIRVSVARAESRRS